MTKFVVDDAPGGDPVETLWAWIAIDSMGGEGLAAAGATSTGLLPMVSGSERLARGPMRELILDMIRQGANANRRFELRTYEACFTLDKLGPS